MNYGEIFYSYLGFYFNIEIGQAISCSAQLSGVKQISWEDVSRIYSVINKSGMELILGIEVKYLDVPFFFHE